MAVIGLFIAMLLILAAVQIQSDYQQILYSKTSQDSIADFLVINKIVTDKNIGSTTLTAAEINDLKQQPFVEKIGALTPSRFRVGVQSISKQIPFYSDFFFESVPDEFLDVTSPDWKWNENSTFIPMIIPNMFLDMYNFGYAQSQHLPQLSQDLVKNLPVQIDIQTPAGIVNYYGKVVGFSDRISSVLVPQPFMDWANKKFGTGANQQPSPCHSSPADVRALPDISTGRAGPLIFRGPTAIGRAGRRHHQCSCDYFMDNGRADVFICIAHFYFVHSAYHCISKR